jgi:glycerol-3-phosphate dehydrogenase
MRDIEDVGRSDCQGRTSCAAGCAAPCARRLGDTGQENKPSAPTTATQQNSDQHEEDEEVLDVVVIGAGVIGCSVARELSRYMLNVLVIEKHQDVSQGASKANSGVVHGGYDARHGTVKSELSLRGNQMFPQLESELHFGFKPIGSLVLAFNDEDVHQLDLLMENGRKNGVTSLKLLDVKELRALEPNVSLAAKRALYCPDAGIASPYEYTIALAENAAHNGVGFLLGEAVVSIRRVEAGSAADAEQGCTAGSGHGARMFVVETSSGRVVRTRCVVNCAGLFADELSRAAGAEPLEISPRKGEYIILDRTQGATVRHVLFQAPTRKWGKGEWPDLIWFGVFWFGLCVCDWIAHR